MGEENLEPLPDVPPNLAGESEDHGKRYHITVSNASGYLCHIHMQVSGFDIAACMPAVLPPGVPADSVCWGCSPHSTATQRASFGSSPTQVRLSSSILKPSSALHAALPSLTMLSSHCQSPLPLRQSRRGILRPERRMCMHRRQHGRVQRHCGARQAQSAGAGSCRPQDRGGGLFWPFSFTTLLLSCPTTEQA
jgi:hypothetical protein